MSVVESPPKVSKACECSTQTDFTLSDITNLETYQNFYINDCWKAFSEFAKFRKEILKKVKDDYIEKEIKAKKKKIKYHLKKELKNAPNNPPISTKKHDIGKFINILHNHLFLKLTIFRCE